MHGETVKFKLRRLNNTMGWFLSKLYSLASLIAKEERLGQTEGRTLGTNWRRSARDKLNVRLREPQNLLDVFEKKCSYCPDGKWNRFLYCPAPQPKHCTDWAVSTAVGWNLSIFKVYGYFPIFRGTGFSTTAAILDHGTEVRKESFSVYTSWADYIIPYAGGNYVNHSDFKGSVYLGIELSVFSMVLS
jgi:hypothetical protein